MSSFAGYCEWCYKPVMHKTLFGTLHICLTDEEKALVMLSQQDTRSPQKPSTSYQENATNLKKWR